MIRFSRGKKSGKSGNENPGLRAHRCFKEEMIGEKAGREIKRKRIRGVSVDVGAAHLRIIGDIIVNGVTAGNVDARSLIEDTGRIAGSVNCHADTISPINTISREATTKVITGASVEIAEALQKTQDID